MTEPLSEKIRAYVEKVVAAAPPLSPMQKARIGAIMTTPKWDEPSAGLVESDDFDSLREVLGNDQP